MLDADNQDILPFLSNNEFSHYGLYTGILKEMHDTLSVNLADATTTEEAAIRSHVQADQMQMHSAPCPTFTEKIRHIKLLKSNMKCS